MWVKPAGLDLSMHQGRHSNLQTKENRGTYCRLTTNLLGIKCTVQLCFCFPRNTLFLKITAVQ